MSSSSPLTEAPEGGFSAKAMAIAITPKVTGGISILCSAYLIHHIVSVPQRRSLTYQRLVAFLCFSDLASSLGIFLSTWPLPVGNNFGALYQGEPDGSNALCTAQGVLIHWGITTAMANVVLSTHYLLVVKFRFSEPQMKRLEPYYIAAIFLLGMICISIPLSMHLYGYNPYSRNIWCFIFVPPEDCEDEADCIRLTVVLRWALFFGPLWFCILLCMALMMALYCIVKRIESAAVRWRSTSWTKSLSASTKWPSSETFEHQRHQHRKNYQQTKKVARQAILYGVSFIVVWLPLLVLNTFNLVRKTWFNPEEPNGFVVLWFVMVFQPLQGLLNLIIYRKFGVVRAVTSSARRLSSFVSNRRSSRSQSMRYEQSCSNISEMHLAAATATAHLLDKESQESDAHSIRQSPDQKGESGTSCSNDSGTEDIFKKEAKSDRVARNSSQSDEEDTHLPVSTPIKQQSADQVGKDVEPSNDILSNDVERNVHFATKNFVQELGGDGRGDEDIPSGQETESSPSEIALEVAPAVPSDPSTMDDIEKTLEMIYGDYRQEPSHHHSETRTDGDRHHHFSYKRRLLGIP